jgi:hypothetical protein
MINVVIKKSEFKLTFSCKFQKFYHEKNNSNL